MAVSPGTGQGQEQPARADRPGIELDGAGHVGGRRLGRGDVGQFAADDLRDPGDAQLDHRRTLIRSSAAASSSRSSNGRVTPAAV